MTNLLRAEDSSLVSDVIEWDISTWRQSLRFWSDRVDLRGKRVLEIGSRRGGLSLWAALSGAESVVCSDLGGPQEQARTLHRLYGVEHQVVYADLSATELGAAGQFDVVLFKSVLGSIGANNRDDLQKKAVGSMYEALQPGGCLLFAENLAGTSVHKLMRRLTPWGRSWNYVSEESLRTLLQPYAKVEMETSGFAAAFGRTERQRSVLAKLDAAVVRHIPNTWRYVAFGVAWK